MDNSIRQYLRRVRNSRVVLACLVSALRFARSLGILTSRRTYSHVPFKGIVSVPCIEGRSFLIESKGHNIENSLYWDGLYGHEPITMKHWVMASSNAGTVLDIGANSGVFALSAAAAGALVVHAFEPVNRIHQILRQNVNLNPSFPIKTWAYAVGEKDGIATLYDPGGDAPTSASLSFDFAHTNFKELMAKEVEVVSIDSWCDRQGIEKLDLIKLDVEGFEEAALMGMRKIVARSKPLIVLEVLGGHGTNLHALVDDMWPGLYQWHEINEGAGYTSRNVLLTPLSESKL